MTDSGLLVEAAVRGQGVALARWSLIQDELAAGRLYRVFPRTAPLPVGHAYSLVGLRETFRRPEVAAFRDWLRLEIGTLAAAPHR
jgi:LysR family glycine cleavage system transcriptional activator